MVEAESCNVMLDAEMNRTEDVQSLIKKWETLMQSSKYQRQEYHEKMFHKHLVRADYTKASRHQGGGESEQSVSVKGESSFLQGGGAEAGSFIMNMKRSESFIAGEGGGGQAAALITTKGESSSFFKDGAGQQALIMKSFIQDNRDLGGGDRPSASKTGQQALIVKGDGQQALYLNRESFIADREPAILAAARGSSSRQVVGTWRTVGDRVADMEEKVANMERLERKMVELEQRLTDKIASVERKTTHLERKIQSLEQNMAFMDQKSTYVTEPCGEGVERVVADMERKMLYMEVKTSDLEKEMKSIRTSEARMHSSFMRTPRSIIAKKLKYFRNDRKKLKL